MGSLLRIIVISLAIALTGAQAESPAYSRQFVDVGDSVKLEVLDWGGSGRAMVLIAGIGAAADDWNNFAPKLASSHHVYSISRRGFGLSSVLPPTKQNYTADRLGDDVLAVMEALKLQRPILVGHSFGGTELSSIGSRYPETVAGLVYLDAAYGYAFDPAKGPRRLSVPRDVSAIERACWLGGAQYTHVDAPVLAIYAIPQAPPLAIVDNPAALAEWRKDLDRETAAASAQADAFGKGIPSARVIRIANARHYVHESNEAEVLQEVAKFEATLSK